MINDIEILQMAIEGYKAQVKRLEDKCKSIHADRSKDLDYALKFVKDENIWEWYTSKCTPDENYQVYQEKMKAWEETGVKPGGRADMYLEMMAMDEKAKAKSEVKK